MNDFKSMGFAFSLIHGIIQEERKERQMRKFLITLSFCLFLFASLPVFAAQEEKLKGEAVVTTDSLNVRSGPSREYEKIGSIKRDTIVEVVGIVEPDWYVIEFESEKGYISSQYVTFTPYEEVEHDFGPLLKNVFIMALVVMILIVAGIMVYTFVDIQKRKEEEEGEGEEIPITNHDDTNMLMGEVTYDTFRLDIDPKYFETTTIIPQPESVYGEQTRQEEAEWRSDILGEATKVNKKEDMTEMTIEGIDSLDSKLEQASAQIAALQKEVEQLKKQKPET